MKKMILAVLALSAVLVMVLVRVLQYGLDTLCFVGC